MANSNTILFEEVDKKIFMLRGQQIMLDSDVAILYGVETRDINKAVKNNPDKLEDFYKIVMALTK